MKNSWRCFLLILSFSQGVLAGDWHFQLGATTESRAERDQGQQMVGRTLAGGQLGIGYQDFLISLEYASFRETTGTNALVIDRWVQNYLLWGLWMPTNWGTVIPFLGAGLGQSNESIDTTLLGVTTSDHSRPQVIGGGSFGLRANIPVLWLSVELRVLGAERGDPNPSAALMGRLGLYF